MLYPFNPTTAAATPCTVCFFSLGTIITEKKNKLHITEGGKVPFVVCSTHASHTFSSELNARIPRTTTARTRKRMLSGDCYAQYIQTPHQQATSRLNLKVAPFVMNLLLSPAVVAASQQFAVGSLRS